MEMYQHIQLCKGKQAIKQIKEVIPFITIFLSMIMEVGNTQLLINLNIKL